MLPEYQSSSESEAEEVILKQRKTKIAKNWVHMTTFECATEAKKWIANEKIWSYSFANDTEDGKKIYYRCNQAKFREEQCKASIHLLYCSDSSKVHQFKTEDEHSHEMDKTKITDDIKVQISNMLEIKMKPRNILININRDNQTDIKMSTLRNAIARIKTSKYGPSSISLGELEQWCIDNFSVPEDDDEPFVVDHKFIYENEDDEDAIYGSRFRFFLSSKTLLKIASTSKIICADGTYKLNWQGYPVLITGTTDSDRHFHSFGLAVCTNEEAVDFKFMFDAIQSGYLSH